MCLGWLLTARVRACVYVWACVRVCVCLRVFVCVFGCVQPCSTHKAKVPLMLAHQEIQNAIDFKTDNDDQPLNQEKLETMLKNSESNVRSVMGLLAECKQMSKDCGSSSSASAVQASPGGMSSWGNIGR